MLGISVVSSESNPSEAVDGRHDRMTAINREGKFESHPPFDLPRRAVVREVRTIKIAHLTPCNLFSLIFLLRDDFTA
jgi:hypothetical protein